MPCRRQGDILVGRFEGDQYLERVQLHAVPVAKRDRLATAQRRAVQQHAVGTAVFKEVQAVQVAHEGVLARHALRMQNPVAMFGAADAEVMTGDTHRCAFGNVAGMVAEHRQYEARSAGYVHRESSAGSSAIAEVTKTRQRAVKSGEMDARVNSAATTTTSMSWGGIGATS